MTKGDRLIAEFHYEDIERFLEGLERLSVPRWREVNARYAILQFAVNRQAHPAT